MYTRQEVAKQLRAAATEIQNLTNEKAALMADNEELLAKIASLQEAQNVPLTEEIPDTALQKEAEYGFSLRGGNGFGSSADDLPMLGSDLTPEQRLDMILNGESPSDFE